MSIEYRNCRFKLNEIFDNEMKNVTKNLYDFFMNDELDLTGDPQVLGDEIYKLIYNIEIRPLISSSYQVGQLISKPENSGNLDLSSFLVENDNLLMIIFIGYLSTIFSIFIISKFSRHTLNFYHVLALENQKKSTKYTILLFIFSVFLFFNLNILINMIKTESVVVDTHQFIDSKEKLIATHKILIYDPIDKEMFITKPSYRFLYKLYERKKKKNEIFEVSIYDRLFFTTMDKRGDDYFFIAQANYFLRLLASFSYYNFTDRIAFMKPYSYYDSFDVIYLRKNLNLKMKNLIHDR